MYQYDNVCFVSLAVPLTPILPTRFVPVHGHNP